MTGMLVRYCPDLYLFSEFLLTPDAKLCKEFTFNLKISEAKEKVSSELT